MPLTGGSYQYYSESQDNWTMVSMLEPVSFKMFFINMTSDYQIEIFSLKIKKENKRRKVKKNGGLMMSKKDLL